jgi:hypothetical protein
MDGVVVFNEPPAELFKGAAQHYMQHRFEPKLQVGRDSGTSKLAVGWDARRLLTEGASLAICQATAA